MKLSLKIVFALFLLFSIAFSYTRYYYFPLDGDLPAIVLPDKSYQPVLHDPLGLNVLLKDSIYPATNRFFTHFSMVVYFKSIPLLLQSITSPINSIYLSCALAKTLIQFFLVFLLAVYITGSKKFRSFDFLLTAAIITPLFQIFGYYEGMGIIDHSVTYTFFYALALGLVLLFFLPIFTSGFHRDNFKFSFFTTISLVFLAMVISLNGPLNTPVVLLVCPFSILYYLYKNFIGMQSGNFLQKLLSATKKISPHLLFIFGFAILASLYSFYIGLNNLENFWETIPIHERYARLPMGLWKQYTFGYGPVLMVITVLINAVIIKKYSAHMQKEKIMTILKWFAFLSILYICLLPLGGYRPYRPNIIRMDTIMPVTLGMIFFYGLTTFHVIKYVQINYKKIYYLVIFVLALFYIKADKEVRKYNLCERDALKKISESREKIVFLENDCTVMNWGITTDTANSENKTGMLLYWGVINEKKLYYQKEAE